MRPSHKTSVMLLAIGAAPAAGLVRTAVRKGWAVRWSESARAGYREILHHRPQVAIVQAAPAAGEELKLIRFVRADLLPVSLLAVTTVHDDETERAARIAGIDGYLSGTTDAALLERTVAELLARRRNDKPRFPTPGSRGINESNDFSLSSSLQQETRVAGLPPPPPVRKGRWNVYDGAGRRPARNRVRGRPDSKGA